MQAGAFQWLLGRMGTSEQHLRCKLPNGSLSENKSKIPFFAVTFHFHPRLSLYRISKCFPLIFHETEKQRIHTIENCVHYGCTSLQCPFGCFMSLRLTHECGKETERDRGETRGQWNVRTHHNSWREPSNVCGSPMLAQNFFPVAHSSAWLRWLFSMVNISYAVRGNVHERIADVKYWCKQMFRFASFKKELVHSKGAALIKSVQKPSAWCMAMYAPSFSTPVGHPDSRCLKPNWRVFSLRVTSSHF